MIKVAINGFGRIGRSTFKAILKNKFIEIRAINNLSSPELLLNLLKYDSVHGKFPGELFIENGFLVGDFNKVKLVNEKDPENLPWKELDIDVVVEATGKFLTIEKANKHIQAGSKKVVTTAIMKKGEVPTVVMGVNDHILTGKELIVSNASCTTNCLAPLLKILDENFIIEKGFINTIHAYTTDQKLHDSSHKDLRRARAANISIIPTTTGAAKSIDLILPNLTGKLDGLAMRVPVINGSCLDLTTLLKIKTTKSEINAKFKEASLGPLKNILEFTSDPIVSVDNIGNPHSCIFDSNLTYVKNNLIKVIAWYDNEVGYSNRIVDLIIKLFL